MITSQLGLLLDGADFEFVAVLLEDLLVVVLPELLGRVLAGHPLQDLGATWVLVEEVWCASGGLLYAMVQGVRKGMLTCDVVDASVDDDPHAVALVLVLGDVGHGVLVRHVDRR